MKVNSTHHSADRITELLHSIDTAFDRSAWHGPNLRNSLRGLTLQEAAWRPAPGRHNIWEIAVHAAYWKYVVRRKITGEKRNSFPLPGSNWFERPVKKTASAWKEDLRLLEDQHLQLRDAVGALASEDLARGFGRQNLGDFIRGIAFHDVYHAGQIRLLRRLQKPDPRRR